MKEDLREDGAGMKRGREWNQERMREEIAEDEGEIKRR
jgi:hypothetical protein